MRFGTAFCYYLLWGYGKKLRILTYFLFIYFNSVYSQTDGSISLFDSRIYTFSYFGNNLINPGAKAGITFTLTEKTTLKNKTKKKGKKVDKSSTKQLLAGADIGFFWQPESHIGVFNYYEIIYRKIKLRNNSYSIIGIGPGIYRSFYPETFEVDDNDNVNKVTFGGRTYFAPVLTFGTGKFKTDSFLHSLTFATNLMFLFDSNSGIVPLLNFEIGFCFDFKKGEK